MSAIATLTPSSAIHETYLTSAFVVGQANRVRSELSGKGHNVGHATVLRDPDPAARLRDPAVWHHDGPAV